MVRFDEDDGFADGCRKLTMSFLSRNGFFRDNSAGTITWEVAGRPAGSLKLITYVMEQEKPFIQLIYDLNVPESKELKKFDYRVYLDKVNSILFPEKYFYYFVCPMTGKRTSILYKPNKADLWLHREGFKMIDINTLDEKNFKNLEGKYGLELENKIAKLREKLKGKLKTDYKKVPVKLVERLRDLENRVNKFYIE
jgi:hypothetical protein